ncbi:MAG: substrate-binding domain-containing protein [Alkalibacterium sp.]|nr:substrate-binding domain-containing protein [Alkalibacterium sp.]
MITIREVAERAQTSIATVSRVLNNLDGYSEQTKVKVLKAAEELGYESNAIARSMIIKKTNTIGVVFPNISSMITYEFLNGIEDVTYKNDFSVIVSYTYSQPERMMKALRTLYEKRVDGIIFTSDEVTDDYLNYLEKIDIPVVFLSTKSEKSTIPYVKVNDFAAAFDAVDYLIKNEHTNIGLIAGNPDDTIAGIPRIEGYKAALKKAGLPVREEFIRYGYDFSFNDGKSRFEDLINENPDITAVFAVSDEMASGAITAAHQMGIDIPGQISIMGYDNTMISEVAYPALTTLAQPLRKMGSEAVKLLIKMIKGDQFKEEVVLDHSVIERQSVKKRNKSES